MKISSFLNNDPKARTVFSLFAMSCMCCLLALFRVYISDRYGYLFLLWNLFLAWIPLALSWFLQNNYFGKNRNLVFISSVGFLWLLFFPNAPYLVTDLMHLNHKISYIPLWFDTLLLFSFAVAGLMIGYLSLYFIHIMIKDVWNTFTSWLLITCILSLSAFGIYLGRVLRANSWDLFTEPRALIRDSLSSLTDPIAIKMTLMFSFFLLLSYLILYSIIHMNQRRI